MVFLVRAPSPEGRVGLSRRQLKASPSAVARSAALLEANNLDFARVYREEQCLIGVLEGGVDSELNLLHMGGPGALQEGGDGEPGGALAKPQ